MVSKMAALFNRLAYTGLFTFAFCCGGIVSASDSELSATPDDSYKSSDTYNVVRSPSTSKRSYTGSSRSYSGNILINRNRFQSGYSPQRSGYTPAASGYTAQPAGSSNYNGQHGSNSAYSKTNNYKY